MSSHSNVNHHRSIILRKINLKFSEKNPFEYILENQIRMSFIQTLVSSYLN
jgi:hypothetical protein